MYRLVFTMVIFLSLIIPCFLPAGGEGIPVAAKKGVLFPSPALTVQNLKDKDYWGDGFRAVYKRLRKNLHMPNNFFNKRYALPSPVFRAVYLWDTAFTSQAWKPWDVETACEINRTVIDHADNGRLQHLVSKWSNSDYTQPYVMAWSVWENYIWGGKLEQLKQVYPVLVKYNRWLYENRTLDNGLFFWQHSYESGIDNSPRFGSTDESLAVDTTRLAAIDASSYMVRQNDTLALMAMELGRNAEAEQFKDKASELRKKVNELLWDEESGYYFDLDVDKNELVKHKTIASLFPLFAGIADTERGRRLFEHIIDKNEFKTRFPLPTVARDDPSFIKDMWRGPVWVNTSYMVIMGLYDYGYTDIAADMAFRTADMVYANHEKKGELYEFYDPEIVGISELNRKKGNLYKRITLGNKPQPNFAGWTALANTLVVEYLVGYKKDRGETFIEPCFPEAAKGATFRLIVSIDEITINLKVNDDLSAGGNVIRPGGEKKFNLKCGESLTLEKF